MPQNFATKYAKGAMRYFRLWGMSANPLPSGKCQGDAPRFLACRSRADRELWHDVQSERKFVSS
ncbi:unnamed protein product [Gemmata massiliana]|uniref:Uncharacterized protein n=1 Tax=Gemmata massiliana TaxID=1210884 RepID=A0A6P2DLA5_9BACT|nr:unnamed protein product [Gemmata massiliana]